MERNPLIERAMKMRRELLFELDEKSFCLNCTSVIEVLPAAYFAPLKCESEFVLGVLNVRGQPLPVISLRAKFGLCNKALSIDDAFIVARVHSQSMAIIVDNIVGVISLTMEQLSSAVKLTLAKASPQLMILDKSVVSILDLDNLISNQEVVDINSILLEYTKP